MTKYLDITIYISTDSEGSYTVRVESSEGGQGSSRFRLPFRLTDLAGAVFGVEKADLAREASVENAAPADALSAPARKPADFGAELFETLFQGDARDVLTRADTSARNSPETGLRLRLSMDLQSPGMAEVASLPWELMCRKGQRPLALSTQTPLVRSLDSPMPTEPRPFRAPLRIMALMSNPKGTGTLDLDKERAGIEKSWARLPGVQVDFVRPVRSEILRELAGGNYHVIHYMGHGDFHAQKGGSLLFEKEDGSPDPVSSDEFAMWLADEPLRLVFLNACKTGATSLHASIHPFAGVATALIREHIPAVVAMQFPISDVAAVTFAQTFYERIAQGLPVDAAVAEGRKALYSGKYAEWATPVLYLRSKDGMLFEPAASGPALEAAASEIETGVTAEPAAKVNQLWGDHPEDDLRVFLATPDQDREILCRQIAKSLKALGGVSVVDAVPMEAQDHDEFVDKLVREADLCIHLLGANPGRRMDVDDGQPLRTYPLVQLDIGYRAARSQLVVITQRDRESIGNEAYKAKIDELAKLPREKSRFELVITDKTQIMEAVQAKLAELRIARQSEQVATAGETLVHNAFVDAHVNDIQRAIELVEYLENRRVSTDVWTSDTPNANFAQLDEAVRKYALYIIVAGCVDNKWVSNRKIAILKSAMRNKAALLLAKYSAADTEESDGGRFSKSQFEVSVLKHPDPSWFDAIFQLTAPDEQ
jgi:hypothetical protein